MTIAELAGKIEQRIQQACEEIERLQAAREALSYAPDITATPSPAATRRRHVRRASVPDPALHRPRTAPGSKLAPVLALARELDAGLRIRV